MGLKWVGNRNEGECWRVTSVEFDKGKQGPFSYVIKSWSWAQLVSQNLSDQIHVHIFSFILFLGYFWSWGPQSLKQPLCLLWFYNEIHLLWQLRTRALPGQAWEVVTGGSQGPRPGTLDLCGKKVDERLHGWVQNPQAICMCNQGGELLLLVPVHLITSRSLFQGERVAHGYYQSAEDSTDVPCPPLPHMHLLRIMLFIILPYYYLI